MNLRTIKYFFWTIKNIKSLKNWKNRNFSTPSPDIVKHQVLIKNNLKDSLWIETGTYYGNTTKVLSKISKKTISIEADKDLYELSKKKFNNFQNVEIILGKSEDLLEKAISENLDFENICIYLDAHLCQDHLRNTNTFGTEIDATPILKEMESIKKFLVKFKNVIILIDDIRLFNGNFQNYPSKDFFVEWCKNNNFLWEIEHDILICKKK